MNPSALAHARFSLEDAKRALAERSLYHFALQAWDVVEPATPFRDGWHIRAICEHLQAVTAREIRDLLINIPPGHMKSRLVSVFWPAWSWIRDPYSRWIFSTYRQDLTTRDSLACRHVIQSEWYQKNWGDRFDLISDQNVKTRFQNSKQGYRIASTVGTGTGERCNFLVCLPAGTRILTDAGEIEIDRIVRERLPVKVLGPSGRWQSIQAYEENPGHPLLEIETEKGVLTCTEDHQIYVNNCGFMTTNDVIFSHDLQLHHLRQEFRSTPSPRGAIQNGAVLLSEMLRPSQQGREQHRMEGWTSSSTLPPMRRELHRQSLPVGMEEILLLPMPRGRSNCGKHEGMPDLFGNFSYEPSARALLLSDLLIEGARSQSARPDERELQNWALENTLRSRIQQSLSPLDPRTRRQRLCSLRLDQSGAGSPYRRLEIESRPDQPGDYVQIMLSEGAFENWDRSEMDEPTRIKAIRRRPAPDAVFNLRVAPDHAYYANGFLVHNCDDPHSAEQALSPLLRETAVRWWDETMSTRLNDPKRDCRVIVMQRLHEADLSGHVLERGGYVHLCLPMEFEPDRRCSTVVLPGKSQPWSDPRTQEGEILWQEMHNAQTLGKLKLDLREYGTAGQLQQRPAPRGGGLFKREWFQIVQYPPAGIRWVRYWDLAATEMSPGKEPDYTAGCLMGQKEGIFYVRDMMRGRWSPAGTDMILKQTAEIDGQDVSICIEQEPGASGKKVIAYLVKMLAGFTVRPDHPEKSKELRAEPMAAQAEAGNIRLVNGPWMGAFLAELEVFPAGLYDDQVDAASGAFHQLIGKKKAGTWGR